MPEKKSEKKKKGKFIELRGIKKQLIIGGIIAAIAITGIVAGIIIFRKTPKGGILIAGVSRDLYEIDPILAFEDAYICQQVVETLFESDYTDGVSQVIHNLARDHSWNEEATELICYLRKNVKFHDGTPFNATAVKWNLDRIYKLARLDEWGYLFYLPDGRRIVNETHVIDEYTVKFVLNAPYVPFQQLLTHSTTGILSPTSTPFNRTLSKHTEKLVGTGPFIYKSYDPNSNLTLIPNLNYWGEKPKIDEFVVKFYSSGDDLWNNFLAKESHILLPFFWGRNLNISIDPLINNPNFTIQETLSTNYRYIGMNDKLINLTMRKAISYAINYSYIVEETLQPAIRARSPIPEGILYSDTTSFDVPSYNLTKARQILIDELSPFNSRIANLTANDNITANNEWERLVTEGHEIAEYYLDYKPGHPILGSLGSSVPDNLKQIGIKVILQTNWSFPLYFFTLGWMYEFNDPHCGIGNFHSESFYNWIQLNDSVIDQWIEDGVKETDPYLREQKYYKIQERLIEELYPAVWGFSARGSSVYVSNLKGWKSNPFKLVSGLNKVYFG